MLKITLKKIAAAILVSAAAVGMTAGVAYADSFGRTMIQLQNDNATHSPVG